MNRSPTSPLVVRLTLETADTAADLADNLERLAPHINADLAWGDFYTAFDKNWKLIQPWQYRCMMSFLLKHRTGR